MTAEIQTVQRVEEFARYTKKTTVRMKVYPNGRREILGAKLVRKPKPIESMWTKPQAF